MRSVWVIALLLAAAGSGRSAVTAVSQSSIAIGLFNTTTTGINTTGASLLVATVVSYDTVVSAGTLSDSKSNTWVFAGEYGGAGRTGTGIWYSYTSSSSSISVGASHTITYASSGHSTIYLSAWSGTYGNPLDSINCTGAYGDTISILLGSPLLDGSLIFSAFGSQQDSSSYVSTGVTQQDQAGGLGSTGLGIAYDVQTTKTPVSGNWQETGTNNISTCAASFKPGASTGMSVKRRRVVSGN